MQLTDQEKKDLLIRLTEQAMAALIRAHCQTDSVAVKATRIAYQTVREIELVQEYKK